MENHEIEKIIDKLIIIPDTNILLYLYKCSFNANQNIVELFEKIKDKVIVPSQVFKEYLSHKDEEQAKIDRKYDTFTKDLKKQVTEVKSKMSNNISQSRKYEFPDCDVLETGINHFLDRTVHAIAAYEKSLSAEKRNKASQINSVERIISFWKDSGKIRPDVEILQLMEHIKEGEFRYRYRMPPGYMDEEEKDKETKKDRKNNNFEGRIRKYGDLFIWKEILNIGKEARVNNKIIFLTNDVKEDWWILKGEQNNREVVRMRDELFEEYRAVTQNDNIEFLTLAKFYEIFSDYYKICDIKTRLELDYQTYIQNQVHNKYEDQIERKVVEVIEDIDWEDINQEFCDGVARDIDFNQISVNEVALHYDNEGETAIYDFEVSTLTHPIIIIRVEDRDENWLGNVELKIIISYQLQRDLRNLEEDALSFKSSKYKVTSHKDTWSLLCEMDKDREAEASGVLEDYYNH